MSCNAIAFARASVDLSDFSSLIDVETAATLILAHMKEKFGFAQISAKSKTLVQVRSGNFTVTYMDGRLEVSDARANNYSGDVDALAEEIKTVFQAAAVFLFQAQVQETLSQVGRIEKIEDYNGTRVFTLEV